MELVIKDTQTIFLDEQGRTIMMMNNHGRILVCHYLDMEEKTKLEILEMYIELTGEDGKRIRSFLDFESEENEFCS